METMGQNPESLKGYKSKEDESKFIVVLAIALVAYFLITTGVSVLFQNAFPLIMKFEGEPGITMALTQEGAWYQGSFYYPGLPMKESKEHYAQLMKYDPATGKPPASLGYLMGIDSKLLLDKELGLLVFSSKGVQKIEKDKISDLYRRDIGKISSPFLYEGKPAVIRNDEGEVFLSTFSGNDWKNEMKLTFPGIKVKKYSLQISNLKAIKYKGEYYVFNSADNHLYYMKGFPVNDSAEWFKSVPANYYWEPKIIDDRLKLTVVELINPLKKVKVLTYDFSDNKWEKAREFKLDFPYFFGLFKEGGDGKISMAVQNIDFSLSFMELADGSPRVIKTFRNPSVEYFKTFFPWVLLFSVTAPLILTYVLTVFMNKHKEGRLTGEGIVVRYASLFKRCVARAVDEIIIMGVFIGAGWYMYARFKAFDFTKPSVMQEASLFLGKGVLLMIGITFIIRLMFVIMEGQGGQTPGKMLLGIVVIDADLSRGMRYVGFWKSMGRNLLMVIDSLYSYLVGVGILAYTEKWQRLGDLAVKSIVVEKE